MKKITTYFFAGLGVALAAFFACFLVDSVQVSAADTITVVDLTKSQTLALYGTSIQGAYNTGTEWRQCTFDYYASSADFLSTSDEQLNYLAHMVEFDSLGYTAQELTSLFRQNEFLFYRCKAPQPNPVSTTDLQFNFSFSTDIQGISYFRQIVAFAKYWDDISYITYAPRSSNFGGTATVSFSARPFSFEGRGIDSNTGYSMGTFRTYIQTIDATTDSGSGSVRKRNIGAFPCVDFNLQDIDSTTGDYNSFSISGQTFFLNRAVAYPMWDNPLITQEEFQESGSSTPWSYYYIIALSTPRVTDGYILPEPPQTSPNYSSQIDTIIDIGNQNTTILQRILAKLDLIYQQMQQGEESPSLQDPETIGFDSRTKQEILDGVASADSVLDGVRSSDLPTGASEGIWYAWGRMKDIMPPSLWALYLFALVGGFVGWILYGKRGG